MPGWSAISRSLSLSLLSLASVTTASFIEFQTLPTTDGRDWEFFSIEGAHYLALADWGDGSNTNAKIFLWSGTIFVEFHAIPTKCAADLEFFSIEGTHYLAVATYCSTDTNNINSQIYRWAGAGFVEFQDIPTNGADDCEFFSIEGTHYLAVANGWEDGTWFGGSRNINSKVYRWSGGAFVEFQAIPTSGAADCEFFSIEGVHYLAVANHDDGSSYNVNSKVYRWSGAGFVEFQAIPTNGAADCEFFSIEGTHYLAVANHRNAGGLFINGNSKVYRWSATGFVEYQTIPTSGASDWEFFSIEGTAYLAVANRKDDSSYNVNSKVYRWGGAGFLEYQAIPTSGASGLKFFSIEGTAYLAVTNGYESDNSSVFRGPTATTSTSTSTATATTSTSTPTATVTTRTSTSSAAAAKSCVSHQFYNSFLNECENCPPDMVVAEDQTGCIDATSMGLTELQWVAIGSSLAIATGLASAAVFGYQRWGAQRAAAGVAGGEARGDACVVGVAGGDAA